MNVHKRSHLLNLIADYGYYFQQAFDGKNANAMQQRQQTMEKLYALIDSEMDHSKPATDDWPMLTPEHLEAIAYAYDKGYGLGYDGRKEKNPFVEAGSQAEAFNKGYGEGTRAREQDQVLYQNLALAPSNVNVVISEVWHSMGGYDAWMKQFGYVQFAHAIIDHFVLRKEE